jgi:hypothetical protein
MGTNARFHGPYGLAVDSFGGTYVADSGNDAIRYVNSAGAILDL